ncbi:hypothetical protein D9619_004822 [Psilocybe cf. subviscida]|uniref:Fe2OG dioxygenase domain-containing protein n=1 Tax=Psilocybe cf. subviscida TaxID=2480587 RepID=A0A8H5F8F8_9AGAR|nr:hypothetical protein D9619_004822 [Psilocybe cf. subviscida]
MDNPSFTALKKAFSSIEELPYCEGSMRLDDPSISKVFYQKDGDNASMVDFMDARDDQLKALADACQAASFGLNKQDVVDETYRKAGKIDNTRFATMFNPRDVGILDAVVTNLLRGRVTADEVVAELYKLNVYGPGSFFKPHVDTPRSADMFGSLVIVLPTKHEGGTLIFRHEQRAWNFDSAAMIGQDSKVVYAAFLGDVEHEVLPVISGYRVTLTYNLYSRKRSGLPTAVNMRDYPGLPEMRDGLLALLKDTSFLPEGGFLGWGLSHRYPFDMSRTQLSDIKGRLRGADSIVYGLCTELGLDISLKAIYRDSDPNLCDFCLSDRFLDLDTYGEIECPLMTFIEDELGGQYCRPLDKLTGPYYWYFSEDAPFKAVAFVKPLTKTNSFKSTYLHYGNEATLASAYGEVCLVVPVAPATDRK